MVYLAKLPLPDLFEGTRSPEAAATPLADYVLKAKQIDDEEFAQQTTHFPTKLWRFTRALKGHVELQDLDADEALDRIQEALSPRFPGRDPIIDVLQLDEDDEIQFLTTWDRVEYPTNCTLLEEALEQAKLLPLVPERCKKGSLPKYKEFVSLAGHLQILRGDKSILLPCEKVGKLIDRSPAMVSRYRQLAEKDGYLKVLKPHRSPGSGRGEATEFRFALDRFPELQQKMTPIEAKSPRRDIRW